jgi:hypothetical protein
MNETTLHNHLSSSMVALQQSPDELLIELRGHEVGQIRRDSKAPRVPVKCGLSIRGVDISGNFFCSMGQYYSRGL